MLPKCCGRQMKLRTEGIRFLEAVCEKCGDIVYIKKSKDYIPQLLDD